MNIDKAEQSFAGRLQQKIDTLRQIHRLDVESGDLFHDLLLVNSSTLTDEDRPMLAIAIEDALNGIDISQKYPDFYKRLLQDDLLGDLFDDAIETFTLSQDPNWNPLPRPASRDLSFLKKPRSLPDSIRKALNKWIVKFHKSVDELNLLFSTDLQPALRRRAADLETQWMTLIQDTSVIKDTEFQILLEASQTPDKPAHLSLFLFITTKTDQAIPWQQLHATLEWGAYNDTVAIAEQGKTQLGDIPLQEIMTADGGLIPAGLNLNLHINLNDPA